MSGSKKSTGSSKSRFTAQPPKTADRSVTPAASETPKVVKPVMSEVKETQPKATANIPAAAPAAHAVAAPAAAQIAKVSDSQLNQWIVSLRDISAESAQVAAKHLGESGDRRAVAPLIELVRNADGYFHSGVRAAAAEALARLGDRSAVDVLIGAIGDNMAEASAEAVRALATLADPKAIAPLIDVVRNTDGYYLPVVRRAAVAALAHLGGTEARTLVAHVAADVQEDAGVRDEASKSTSRTSN